ncbi:DNA replication complex GINS protein PSF2-like isoform X2 [Styela clava]
MKLWRCCFSCFSFTSNENILIMDHVDIEFLAEREHVSIIPKFNSDKMFLISGEVGPFNVGVPTEVPIWLAINLKQRNECQIQRPTWMELATLETMKEDESNSELFTPLPSPYFQEISHILLNQATDNIPHADGIRTIIKDILDIRVAKLRSSIDKFVKLKATYAKLDNLSQMEINTVRAFLTTALDHMRNLDKTEKLTEQYASVN